MEEFDPNKLSDEEIRLVVNLYYKKWRASHKDNVLLSNMNYRKKCQGKKKDYISGSIDARALALQPIR